jgi:UDP-N-acetylglucosamine diphosphorylase/glucosamine-1-phosphate N-acetyltransferase
MKLLTETCIRRGETFLIECSGQIIGAYIPEPLSSPTDAIEYLQSAESSSLAIVEVAGHVVNRMWQVLDHISEAISWDASLVEQHVSPLARVHPTVILDWSAGPVIIGDNVTIDAFAVLKGPVAIGSGSSIKPHSSLNNVVLGPHTRIGGEMSDCVIQGWSNKQHDGFLGHSYVGEWVNLGAGTTTSNLKNDYGNVRVSMPWGVEDSERMFLGLLIGDHSKTAIGTRFSTGTICGVSSNIVSQNFAPKSIGSFRWLDEVYEIEKAIQVARTAMARRGVELGPETEAVLRYLAG